MSYKGMKIGFETDKGIKLFYDEQLYGSSKDFILHGLVRDKEIVGERINICIDFRNIKNKYEKVYKEYEKEFPYSFEGIREAVLKRLGIIGMDFKIIYKDDTEDIGETAKVINLDESHS